MVAWLTVWLFDCLIDWRFERLMDRLCDLFNWLCDCSIAWLIVWLFNRLTVWSIMWLFDQLCECSIVWLIVWMFNCLIVWLIVWWTVAMQALRYTDSSMFIQGCHWLLVSTGTRFHLRPQTAGSYPVWWSGVGQLCSQRRQHSIIWFWDQHHYRLKLHIRWHREVS